MNITYFGSKVPLHMLIDSTGIKVAELKVRIAVLNGYAARGIPVTEPLG